MPKQNKMKKYSAKYFEKAKKIIKNQKDTKNVILQFFQKENKAVLCGIDEVLTLLKKNTNIKKYKIKYLKEGSIINDGEVVLQLEGPYQYFGYLEGIIDGILARQTSIATNAKRIVQAANKKEVIFMGDRMDRYINQKFDGYAAAVGGVYTQVTNEQVKLHKGSAIGTMPHALIQMFDGEIIEALKAYKKTFPKEKLIALVDFNNDVINDSLKVLNYFGKELKAVRVDTSHNVSDKFFEKNEEYGVTPNLIKALRKSLNKNKGKHVKIIISSELNVDKITYFEKEKTPVDFYGVGRSILNIHIFFTADAVKINGKEVAKFGRKYNLNKKLITLK